MIQILKQRPFKAENGKLKKPMTWVANKLENRISVGSVAELMANIEQYVERIPKDMRFNLHYTLAECDDEAKNPRKFISQDIIPFDVDGIDVSRIEAYHEPILRAIGNLQASDTAIIHSGRGLHFLVGTDTPITEEKYFEETREYYKIICDRIDRTLKSLDLPGTADRGLWATKHTLRLPLTKNIKTRELGYPEDFIGDCVPYTRIINPIPDLTIKSLAGVDEVLEDEYINIKTKQEGGNYIIDPKGVEECLFIQHCVNNAATLKEPEWREMLGIVSRVENGRELCHEYSKAHPGYDYNETEAKIDSRVAAAGPGLCKTIESRIWAGCVDCPHYNKVNSPVSIRSKDFIATKETGFRDVKIDKQGNLNKGSVNFEDLRRFFEQEHQYIVTESKMCYIWTGKHWKYFPDVWIDAFAQHHIDPAPRSNDRTEFRNLIYCTNVIEDEEFFEKSTYKKMNLKNGILDLSGDKPNLIQHSPDVGFLSVLNYEYDPEALCPRFDKFLEEVTLGRSDLSDILMEFAGYAFSNDKCLYHKALILLGEGSNGKSTLLNVIQELAGKHSYSGLSLLDLEKEQQRDQLRGKLFNISDETPKKGFLENSAFKNLVTGGSMSVKVLYKQPFTLKNKAKLIISSNKLPRTFDSSYGFFRRLLIVPFDARFEGEAIDEHIEDKLISEASGILNKIIAGYKRLTTQRGFTKSEAVAKEVREMEMDTNPVLSFVKDKISIEDGEEKGDPLVEIYHSFKHFCEDEGLRYVMTKREFLGRLKIIIPDLNNRVYRRGKNKVTEYKGITLVENKLEVSHDSYF